ncbi:MAG: VOC family protein [Acidobacteriota bacterium]
MKLCLAGPDELDGLYFYVSRNVEAIAMKFHLALNVKSLSESLPFYVALFGVQPSRLEPDYANFDLNDPSLNLTLLRKDPVTRFQGLDHLGFQLSSEEALQDLQRRLERAGLATRVDADSPKQCRRILLTDPNGYRWEAFRSTNQPVPRQVFQVSPASTLAAAKNKRSEVFQLVKSNQQRSEI